MWSNKMNFCDASGHTTSININPVIIETPVTFPSEWFKIHKDQKPSVSLPKSKLSLGKKALLVLDGIKSGALNVEIANDFIYDFARNHINPFRVLVAFQ